LAYITRDFRTRRFNIPKENADPTENALTRVVAACHRIVESPGAVNVKWRKLAISAAVLVFLIGLIVSIRAQPGLLSEVRLRPLMMLLFVFVPGQLVLNAVEFFYVARCAGANISIRHSLRTTLFGSLANTLPIPGATITRLVVLKMAGVPAKSSAIILLIFTLFWIGINGVYSGAWMAALDLDAAAAVVASAGAAITVAAAILLWKTVGVSMQAVLPALSCRILSILLDALRLVWAFLALGAILPFAEASVLTISGVIGGAVSVIPAGLGLRELVLAALAPLVAARASTGFLAAALTRIAVLLTVGPVVVLDLMIRRSTVSAGSDHTSP
jgi:hypothetical protein